LVELYLGRKSVDAVLAATQKPEERCEAQFYVGIFELARGGRAANANAGKAFQAAVDSCPKDFPEYRGALEELKRVR
jgi:lipoprotein NlpI